MTDEFRIRELESAVEDQRTTILFLAKMLTKMFHERDHARDLAVSMETEIFVLKHELSAIKNGG